MHLAAVRELQKHIPSAYFLGRALTANWSFVPGKHVSSSGEAGKKRRGFNFMASALKSSQSKQDLQTKPRTWHATAELKKVIFQELNQKTKQGQDSKMQLVFMVKQALLPTQGT